MHPALSFAIPMFKCHHAFVTATVAGDAFARGYEALAAGDWVDARDAFRERFEYLTDMTK